MFLIFIAILKGNCPDLKTNIVNWDYTEKQEYLIAKHQCVTMRLPCVKEFFAIKPEGYRSICGAPKIKTESSKTE